MSKLNKNPKTITNVKKILKCFFDTKSYVVRGFILFKSKVLLKKHAICNTQDQLCTRYKKFQTNNCVGT